MTYKKGWSFRVQERDSLARPVLWIRVQVQDSYYPDQMIDISSMIVIPPFIDDSNERYTIDWLFNEIRRVEIHEAQEWFKIDGQIYDDPHNPKPQIPLQPLTRNVSGAKTLT